MPQTNEQRKANWATNHEAVALANLIEAGMPKAVAKLEFEKRHKSIADGFKTRDAGMIEHEGRMCPVLWRRGGVVYIEVEPGIRKEVAE